MADRKTTDVRPKPEARSRVSNGRALFLEGVDGRTAAARRYRDVQAAIVADLGGDDAISEGERQLVRTAASLAVQREQADARVAAGDKVDAEDYVRIVNALTRVLQAIGLRRRAKDVTPSLHEHLANMESAQSPNGEDK